MEILEIPFAPGYQISEYGEVYSPHGRELKYGYSREGYLTVSIDKGKGLVSLFLDRLVASTFLGNNYNDRSLVVNHRDLDIYNNDYTNLEWVTVRMNNVHRAIFNPRSRRITVIARNRRGDVLGFNNAWEAARYTEMHYLDVWDCIQFDSRFNGWSFEHRGFSDRLPVELHEERFLNRDSFGRLPARPHRVKDLVTSETWKFDTVSRSARYFGVDPSSIKYCLDRANSLLKRRYQIVPEGESFPVITEERLNQLNDHGGKEVYAIEISQGKVLMFKSAKEFYSGCNLSKTSVTRALKDRRIKEVHGYVFCYNRDKALVEELERCYLHRK